MRAAAHVPVNGLLARLASHAHGDMRQHCAYSGGRGRVCARRTIKHALAWRCCARRGAPAARGSQHSSGGCENLVSQVAVRSVPLPFVALASTAAAICSGGAFWLTPYTAANSARRILVLPLRFRDGGSQALHFRLSGGQLQHGAGQLGHLRL